MCAPVCAWFDYIGCRFASAAFFVSVWYMWLVWCSGRDFGRFYGLIRMLLGWGLNAVCTRVGESSDFCFLFCLEGLLEGHLGRTKVEIRTDRFGVLEGGGRVGGTYHFEGVSGGKLPI